MSLSDIYNDIDNDEEILRPHMPSAEVVFDRSAWERYDISGATGFWAYATNMPLIGEAKKGSIAREAWTDAYDYPAPHTEDDLLILLNRDGILYLGHDLPSTGHVIAVFAHVNPQYGQTLDLRRDSNGLWSYRTDEECGAFRGPQQVDFKGAPIVDVLKADFGHYENFLGFARLPPEGLWYFPRIEKPQKAVVPCNSRMPG